MGPYLRPMALHRASFLGPHHHRPHQKPKTNTHEEAKQSPRCPLFFWPGPWKGKQILQALGSLQQPCCTWGGDPSIFLICTQG